MIRKIAGPDPGSAEAAEADLMQRQIAALFPGWQVWYIPASATWCARPWPLISVQDIMQLQDEVAQAHAEAREKWPALAADYDLTGMPDDFPYDISDLGRTQPDVIA